MALEDIAVVDVDAAMTAGNVRAIVHEVEALLARLIATGAGGSIDLRALPLAPGEHAALERWFGDGEVAATIEALGPTTVRETAVHGVWWVTHYNGEDEVSASFIEVSFLPEILKTDPHDAVAGLERLRVQLRSPDGGGNGHAD
jgi:hydrogenase-1 operon protein HyaF